MSLKGRGNGNGQASGSHITTIPDGGIPGVIESVRSGVMGKRQWKRWIEISTILNPLEIIIDVMHKHGLEVVSGNKPGFNCYYHVLLTGTSEQMKACDNEWRERGFVVHNRKPKGGFEI